MPCEQRLKSFNWLVSLFYYPCNNTRGKTNKCNATAVAARKMARAELEPWPLLAVERPVCTVKAPSSLPTPGLWGVETALQIMHWSIECNERGGTEMEEMDGV